MIELLFRGVEISCLADNRYVRKKPVTFALLTKNTQWGFLNGCLILFIYQRNITPSLMQIDEICKFLLTAKGLIPFSSFW